MDDIIISQYVRPRLTTVTYDKCAMGAQAIDLLVDLINHKPAQSVVIKSDRIIERESIRRLGINRIPKPDKKRACNGKFSRRPVFSPGG